MRQLTNDESKERLILEHEDRDKRIRQESHIDLSFFRKHSCSALCFSSFIFEAVGCVLCNRHRIASCDSLLASFPEIGLFLFLFRETTSSCCFGSLHLQELESLGFAGRWVGVNGTAIFSLKKEVIFAYVMTCLPLQYFANHCEQSSCYREKVKTVIHSLFFFFLFLSFFWFLVYDVTIFFQQNWLSLSCSLLFDVWGIKNSRRCWKFLRHVDIW